MAAKFTLPHLGITFSHRSLFLIVVIVSTWGRASWADNNSSPCDSWMSIPVPVTDQPTLADMQSLRGCDSEALYYGIGINADPSKARLCAFYQIETAKEKSDLPAFEGAGILMMIYANGKSTVRNIALARRFACSIWSAPAELEGRLEHLSHIEKTKDSHTDFDVCDDITSGIMTGECRAHEERVAAARRRAALSGAIAKLNTVQRAVLSEVEQSLELFITARSQGEIDLGGTIAPARLITAESAVREQYAETLSKLLSGQEMSASAKKSLAAERELNSIYKRLLTQKEFHAEGVSAEGIKATQRSWLKYRDAWVKFGKIIDLKWSTESLMTDLTVQRVAMLKERIVEQ